MSSSDIFIGETIGTAILILLGGGVCAAVTLKASKARNAGWLAITFGWGFAVLTARLHLGAALRRPPQPGRDPRRSRSRTATWSNVPVYLAGQLLGAMIGAALVWVAYYGQFQAHLTDKEIVGGPGAQAASQGRRGPETGAGPVLGIFSTGPEIRNRVAEPRHRDHRHHRAGPRRSSRRA